MTKKKIIGRPKLPKGEARSEILQVRLTRAERDAIEDKAKICDATASEWARMIVLAKALG